METRLFLIMGAAWLYVLLRFINPLPISTTSQCLLAIAFFLIAEYQQITSRFFGTMASPELPRLVLIAIGWAFGLFLLLFLLLLARDIVSLFALVLHIQPFSRALQTHTGTLVLASLALLLASYGSYQGLRVPKVKKVRITLANLPPAFAGYRIVQLTDIHASRLLPASWIKKVVAKTNQLNADLVLITGDLQDGTPKARSKDIAPLGDLNARDGVLAIVGNHEYYSDYAAWLDMFADIGLPVLLNNHTLIGRKNQQIAIAGITDRQARTFHQARPDIEHAINHIPRQLPVILLSHRPDNAEAMARAGVDLQLSGHTHGGQIWGIHRLTQWANNGYVSGLYEVGHMQLYVSNGTGLWNGLILRLGKPSEITQITLERPHASD